MHQMNKNRKYYSNYIAILTSLGLYGVCFLLLCMNPSPNDDLLDLFNQEEEKKIEIDIQNGFSLSDFQNSESTPKGSENVNKQIPPPAAAITKTADVIPDEWQNSPPLEETVAPDEKVEDPLLQSKVNKMLAELDSTVNRDTLQKKEKKLLEAAVQKKLLTEAEINQLNKEEQQFYRKNYKTILNMRKIYPSVLAVKKIVDELNTQLELSKTKKEKQQLIRSSEQKLFAEFEKDIRVMSYSQGKLLVKLLARETDQTAYNLIKKYKGTIPATFWYGVGILFQENLKTKYDSVGEDVHLEKMVRKYKAGTL
jgi:hypothetical protein